MFCTGMAVCWIYGGGRQFIRGLPYILVLSIFMGGMLYILASLSMFSVIGLLTGFTGLVACFLINQVKRDRIGKIRLYKGKLNLLQAVLPYLLIVGLSILFYLLDPKVSLGFNFPEYQTGLGHLVEREADYVTFNLLKYPFSIIMMASIISMILFHKKKALDGTKVKKIMLQTVKKCVPTTVTIVFLLNMAVIMMDSGMISEIAEFLVSVTKQLYPLAAPFIGLLGAFVTGSNTNSNIIFGSLQETASSSLGMSVAIMCAVQSIGASVGCAIGPTTVSLGSTAAQIQGEESQIYKKTLIPIIGTAFVLGIVNFLILNN